MRAEVNLNIRIPRYKSIVFFVLTLTACSDKIPMADRINSKDELPTISIENYKTTYTEDGKIKAKLQAVLAEQFDGILEPYIDFRKGLSIVLYDKDNRIETSMTADRTRFYQLKKTWEASGNVIISNLSGDILKTEKLYGDDEEKKIFTDKFVQITKSDGSVIYGKKGFESNSDFTIYQFVDVSGILMTKDEFNSNNDSTTIKTDQPDK
jgi:LPS export ABC transporter protein LptC